MYQVLVFELAAWAQVSGYRGSTLKLDIGHSLGMYCVQGSVDRIGRNERQAWSHRASVETWGMVDLVRDIPEM